MLVLMCGMPASGKSTVVDQLFDNKKEIIIRPSDWLPENIESQAASFQKDFRVAAWQVGIEKVLENLPNTMETIVFDSGNAKYHTVHDIISSAKKLDHIVILVYVNTHLKECRRRAGSVWPGDNVARMYVNNVKESLGKYRKTCDKIVVVNNSGNLKNLDTEISRVKKALCQNI